MADLRVLVLASCSLLVTAQIEFAKLETDASSPSPHNASTQGSSSAFSPASVNSSLSSPASSFSASPASLAPSKVGQTRFAGGVLDILQPLGLFTNPCDRCSTVNQHCCNTQGLCCQSQIFPGQFPGQLPGHFTGQLPGHFPGQLPGHFPGQLPGHFPGQFPGHFPGQFSGQFPGTHGGKNGVCPGSFGHHAGFHGFKSGAPCVKECQSDFHCPDIQKCCLIGCSVACRTPQGAPPIKPGSCPAPGFVPSGFRSAAAASQADPDEEPSTLTQQEQQQDPKEGSQDHKERRQQRGEGLGRNRREADDIPWTRRFRRSPHHQEDRNDRREVRLNRRWRVSGRVIRSADDAPKSVVRQTGGAKPSHRFFSCPFTCQSDSDCPGILKCCGAGINCVQCVKPWF